MPVTRINNNQISDAISGNIYVGVNAAVKLQNYSVTATKIANNLTYGSDLTITGNLTVQGNTTTIDTTYTTIEDPVLLLASNQTGSPTVDIGFVGQRGTSNNIAFVWDESADEFVTVYTTTGETNTTINIASYADLHTGNANIGGNSVINGTTSLVGNLIGNVNATANIAAGNILTNGLISAAGNITGAYFVGNGSALTGVTATSAGFPIIAGTSNIAAATNGNIGVTVAGTSNVVTFASTGIFTTGVVSATGNVTGGNINSAANISATGNVTASFYFGNGSQLTGVAASTSGFPVTAGTSNIAAATNGNIGVSIAGTSNVLTIASTGTFTTGVASASGNVTGANINTAGLISATGNINGANLNITGNIVDTGALSLITGASGAIALAPNASNVLVALTTGVEITGTASASGNITGSNLITGGLITATGNVTSSANISGGNVLSSALVQGVTVSASGNVTGGNLITGGLITATGNITSSANVAGGNVIATTTVTAPTITGTIVSASGNVTGGNLITGGLITATGNITSSANVAGGNVIATSAVTAATVSASGDVTGGNLITGGLISSTGNITSAANVAGGNVIATTTVSAPSHIGTIVSVTGNVTSGNVITGGLITATGNITSAANVSGANLVATTAVVTPTVVGTTVTISSTGGLITLAPSSNVSVSSKYINNLSDPIQDQDAATKLYVDNKVTTAISYHEAVFAATTTNLATTTGGTITYAQPNGVANGIGATLTTTGTFDLIDTANVQTAGTRILVKDQANAVQNGIYVWSNATVITRSADADTYGAADADAFSINDYFFVSSGNVNAGSAYIVDSPSGTITFGTSNIQFAQFSQAQIYSANTQAGISLIGTVFSAKVDNNTTAFDGGGNIIVKAGANLTTPNIGAATGTSLSVTGNLTSAGASISGNITGGNLLTAGTASATSYVGSVVSVTGNVTGGNVLSGGLISSTGNITSSANIAGGNVIATSAVTAATVSASGNVTGGNLITGGLISSTGNVTSAANIAGGNVIATSAVTAVTVSASGNVTGGNVLSGGLISSTGNITSAANIAGGNVIATTTVTAPTITGTTVSASGNITGGNVLTGGLISSTGTITSAANITGGNLLTSGLISATGNISSAGNITASFYFGNGSQLTGVTAATSGFPVTAGTSNIAAETNGNIGISIAGTSNVLTVASTGIFTTGVASASGNVTGGNLITGGLITATGNIISAANVSGGNVLSSALVQGVTVSATGNVIGGNVTTVGLVSATGNITSSANVAGGNLIATSNVVAAGISASGNITGGNLLTAGLISSTGNITSAANISGANVLGTNVSASGNITGANINTGGSNGLTLNASTINSNAGRITINSNDSDVDFAVDGSGLGNIFYVDAGTRTASFGNSTQTTNAVVAFNASNSILLPVGNTAQRPATGVTGMLRFNSTVDAVEIYDADSWSTVGTPNFTVVTDDQFTGNGVQTIYTLANAYTTNSVIVSINGVVQIPTSAYSVSGTALTFTEAPQEGDFIDVRGLTTTTQVTSISNSPGNAVVAVNPTAAQVNITGDLSLNNIINSGANGTGNIGNSTTYFNTVFAKATSAQYADLAENYTADAKYESGTVLSFGGDAEVTLSAVHGDARIAGVVSTNPSYIMNSTLESEHVATIALTGRVPTKVTGPVHKGDMMISDGTGRAMACATPTIGTVIGKALENHSGGDGVIEVVVGRL